MQTSRGVGMEDGQTPFVNWVKTNASTVNVLSIVMLIFAAWAAVEIVTNVTGNEIPPVTGMEASSKADDTQRINNGMIVGLGAVAGTLGLVLQLLLPREETEGADESIPEDDQEIDEVVDVMMEDIESEEEDSDGDEEDSDDDSVDEDSIDEGDSLEEGDEVPEDEAEEPQEEDSPEEEEKTPVKKRKF